MTELEDRLRAELDAFAQRATYPQIRPLRPPAGRAWFGRAWFGRAWFSRAGTGRSSRRAARWLAPAAAAAAVAAVVAGVNFTVQPAVHQTTSGAGAIAGIPRYYLTLNQPSGKVATAMLRSTETGAVLSTALIPLLSGAEPSVTGAADGRTFVVMDNTQESAGHGYGVRFYRLRAAPDGRALRVDRLLISTYPLAVDSMALSPDGARMAIAEQSCSAGGCHYNQIRVHTLATGATRTWRTHTDGAPFDLSWAADGRQIGFLWESNSRSSRHPSGYRLLDVEGPGDDLLASGPAVRLRPNPGHDIPAASVTPDGQEFVTSSTRVVRGENHHVTVTVKVIVVSSRTGKVRRVLYTESATGVPGAYNGKGTLADQRCTVLSLDPAGQHPMIQCFVMGRFSFGTLAGGHLLPLSGMPNSNCVRECRGPMWGIAAW
jgi:hypothetical protein